MGLSVRLISTDRDAWKIEGKNTNFLISSESVLLISIDTRPYTGEHNNEGLL